MALGVLELRIKEYDIYQGWQSVYQLVTGAA